MPIPNAEALRFTPRGLVDAFDSTDVYPGACRKLQNLVFDLSNPEIVIARPGVDGDITNFSGFTSPGFISIQVTVGTRVYGMIATGLTAGYDQPFCYDLVAKAFVTVNGCTAGNSEGRPLSPSTSAAWTPPTMAIVGTYMLITHPGYSGTGSNYFGVINLSTMTYTSSNLATHALPSVPTAVANLNNRAYFVCASAVVYYSDVLAPLTATNAGQSLTLGDNSPVLALSGLPVQTTTAGVVSALLCFKSTQIWQITGDAAVTNSLSLNYLSLNIGCSAPRTIAPSPLGTIFMGPDSVYLVNPFGAVMPLTPELSPGATPYLRQPFTNASNPTRAAAAFAGNIYRVCLATVVDGAAVTNDYWFDVRKMRWNGPHTFAYDSVSSAGQYFVLSGTGSGAQLFASYAYPSSGTVYTDNGATFSVDMLSATLQKHDEMAMKQMVESTIEVSSYSSGSTYTVALYGDYGQYLTASTVTTSLPGAVWGANIWGDGSKWTATLNRPKTYQVNWPIPVVFNKLAVEVSGTASASVSIGTSYFRAQKTGYLLGP